MQRKKVKEQTEIQEDGLLKKILRIESEIIMNFHIVTIQKLLKRRYLVRLRILSSFIWES